MDTIPKFGNDCARLAQKRKMWENLHHMHNTHEALPLVVINMISTTSSSFLTASLILAKTQNLVVFAYVHFLVLIAAVALPPVYTPAANENEVYQNVSVNIETPVFVVDKRYLSVAIDMGQVRKHWQDFDFSDRIFTLAEALSPAYVRFGGTDEDFVTFDNVHMLGKHLKPIPKNFTISSEDLDRMHNIGQWSIWDVLIGLNILKRTKGGNWNATNAEKIMKYVAANQYKFGWELGNEPNHFKHFKVPLSPETIAKDFLTLRAILDKFPQYGSVVVGPDLSAPVKHKQTLDRLRRFLMIAKDAVDAISVHQYYFDGRNCSVKDFYDPAFMDFLIVELEGYMQTAFAIAPGSRLWLGETAGAWGGGAEGISDRYAGGFLWMDKLGLAARFNIDVVVRQSFVGGHYALVNSTTDDPTPGYWISLLHKQLVGQRVLEVERGLDKNRMVRVYAHCTSSVNRRYKAGAITLIALNIHTAEPCVMSLSGRLDGLRVHEYLLLPGTEQLISRDTFLNGEALRLIDDTTLPEMKPTVIPGDTPLILPPLTYAFYVIPDAEALACL